MSGWDPRAVRCRPAEFFDARRQVADGEADHGAGAEMLPAWLSAAEDLDVAVQQAARPALREGWEGDRRQLPEGWAFWRITMSL
jgi:hypothetical protein